jgi:hypothetical protein
MCGGVDVVSWCNEEGVCLWLGLQQWDFFM